MKDPTFEPPLAASQNSRVYVIDDDGVIRASLSDLLESLGYATRPFSNAIAFLDELPFLEPAPILLDIQMPGMDGFGLLRELAVRELRWPVIAMSANGTIAAVAEALKLGAVEFLEKPFQASQLDYALLATSGRLSEVRLSTVEKAKRGS